MTRRKRTTKTNPAATATRTMVRSLFSFGTIRIALHGDGCWNWGLGKNHPRYACPQSPAPNPQSLKLLPVATAFVGRDDYEHAIPLAVDAQERLAFRLGGQLVEVGDVTDGLAIDTFDDIAFLQAE